MRKSALILASMAIGIFIPLVTLEIALRFLPVQESMGVIAVNESDPVFRFKPNQNLTWSRGWDFSMVNSVHVNNAGYVNDQDYDQASDKPLFAVVGDSYVEAAMVPYGQTIQGQLAKLVGDDGRVYSFGASGAPLSQYLVWAKEARQNWRANALAVVVVGNDFDESLAAYKQGPGFHHYVEEDDRLSLTRFDYRPGWWRRLAKQSALMRYLVFNLQAPDRFKQFWDTLPTLAPVAKAEDFVGNTAAQADQLRLEQSRKAVRAFLRDLVTWAGWRLDQVVFVVDGIRYPNDSPAMRSSYFVQMREYFIAEAEAAGFETVDMDQQFFARHAREQVAYEFPTDGHWNGLAHGMAADAIAESAVFKRWQRDYVMPRRMGEMSDETPPESQAP